MIAQPSSVPANGKDQEGEMSSGTFRTAASDESPRPILDHQVKSMLEQGNTFSPQNCQPGSQVDVNNVDVQA